MTEPRYAWVVVWGVFFCLALIFGVSYSFAAFFGPFATEFAAQRADVSLVFGLSGLIYFVLGAFGGMLADRFGPRLVCCAGMSCIAGGLFATSLAHSMATVYLAYGVGIGVGIALVYTPSIGCVQPWFTRRRGLASGIASAGIGAGTLVVPLLAAGAIAWLEWRDALRTMALGVLIVGLGAAVAGVRGSLEGWASATGRFLLMARSSEASGRARAWTTFGPSLTTRRPSARALVERSSAMAGGLAQAIRAARVS